MTAQPPPSKPDHDHLIRLGRAYVRLVEAAAVLIDYQDDEREHLRLVTLRLRYQRALRELLAKVPADVAAEILAASEKVHGPVKDVGQN